MKASPAALLAMGGGDVGGLARAAADDYTAEDAAAYEARLAETYAAVNQADAINAMLRDGRITNEEARAKAANNPMLSAVEPQGAGSPDPCAKFIPANVPPGISIDKNIELAEGVFKELMHTDLPEPGAASGRFSTVEVGRTLWFEEQTGDHGPMDYKWLTTDMRYDDFGNFNYGAVGAAMQFTPDTLFRVAGWVQQRGANAHMGRGEAPPTKFHAFAGVGGRSPFGDKPGDQVQIQNGIDYYHCRKGR